MCVCYDVYHCAKPNEFMNRASVYQRVALVDSVGMAQLHNLGLGGEWDYEGGLTPPA